MFGVNKIINLLNTIYYEEKIQVLFKGCGWTAIRLVIRAYLFSLLLVFFVLVQKRTKKEKARIQRSPAFW
jgi:phosphoglycerol transferase MdoB-like AlkP superfamily enzyme